MSYRNQQHGDLNFTSYTRLLTTAWHRSSLTLLAMTIEKSETPCSLQSLAMTLSFFYHRNDKQYSTALKYLIY
jgi:hypothetical protein